MFKSASAEQLAHNSEVVRAAAEHGKNVLDFQGGGERRGHKREPRGQCFLSRGYSSQLPTELPERRKQRRLQPSGPVLFPGQKIISAAV